MHQSEESISPSTQTAKSAAPQLRTFTTKARGAKTFLTSIASWLFAGFATIASMTIQRGREKWVI